MYSPFRAVRNFKIRRTGMTEVYERDLYEMKYAILKSPYHKKVITACADLLEIPPMKMRRLLIENLDMMMLESLGARFDSWMNQVDRNEGVRREIGYDLFTRFIPVISQADLDKSLREVTDNPDDPENVRVILRRLLFGEISS